MKEVRSGLFGGFILATAGGALVLLLVSVWNTVQIARLAARPVPTLVQLSDGRAVRVAGRPAHERTPAVVRRFTVEALQGLFTWRLVIPATEPGQKERIDDGVILSDRKKVPTSVYQAGFFLSEALRPELLRQLADLISATVENRSTQVLFIPSFVGQPEPVDGRPDAWKVIVVGQQTVFTPVRPEGVSLPFNKEIYLRATEPPVIDGLPRTALEEAIYRVRASGLEIYAIRSLADSQPTSP
jgi:hypothetical protein